MPKVKKVASNNMTRVSPYPLRSTRSNKQLVQVSPIEAEGTAQWEDVQCVICHDPPHNAVLLHCSSFHKGCRPYICDTSGRHSNCYKQFYNESKNARFGLRCPLCRGQVYESVKLPAARRFMNAKPRVCTVQNCDFSGTYSQLNTHSKTVHSGAIPPKVDPVVAIDWAAQQRIREYGDLMYAIANANPPILSAATLDARIEVDLTVRRHIDSLVGVATVRPARETYMPVCPRHRRSNRRG